MAAITRSAGSFILVTSMASLRSEALRYIFYFLSSQRVVYLCIPCSAFWDTAFFLFCRLDSSHSSFR